MAKKKRLLMKDLKSSGWYDFASWAMARGFTPKMFADEDKTEFLLTEFRVNIAHKRLVAAIEYDFFMQRRGRGKMLGLLAQVTPNESNKKR